MTSEQEWLAGLKVGDEVAVYFPDNDFLIRPVDRVTQRLVVIDAYGSFSRKTGKTRYGRWISSLEAIDPELVIRRRILERARNISPSRLTTDQLERILAIAVERSGSEEVQSRL